MTDTYSLEGIPGEKLYSFLGQIEKHLLKAIEYNDGRYFLSDIYKAIEIKDMQLWAIRKNKEIFKSDYQNIVGCCVTQIIKYPRKKSLFILFIAGDYGKDWFHLHRDLVSFARSHGCQLIDGWGRSGWKKEAEKLGFKTMATLYTQQIGVNRR